MNNSPQQVFAGGWDQLQHAKLKDTFLLGMVFVVDSVWNPDGTKFMVLNAATDDEILEFTTSIPHNTDGAIQTGQFSINAQQTNPRGMYWHRDGKRFWIVGTNPNNITYFTLTTAWTLSTASYTGISKSWLGTGGSVRDLSFINKGLTILAVERNRDEILEFVLTTPYDITTLDNTPVNIIDILSTSPNPEGIIVRPDNKMVYIVGETNNTIDRYILNSVGTLVDGITFKDSLDLSDTDETNPQGVFIREHDGKLIYVVGVADEIITFDMSLTENNSIITTLGEELTTEAGDNLVYA